MEKQTRPGPRGPRKRIGLIVLKEVSAITFVSKKERFGDVGVELQSSHDKLATSIEWRQPLIVSKFLRLPASLNRFLIPQVLKHGNDISILGQHAKSLFLGVAGKKDSQANNAVTTQPYLVVYKSCQMNGATWMPLRPWAQESSVNLYRRICYNRVGFSSTY